MYFINKGFTNTVLIKVCNILQLIFMFAIFAYGSYLFTPFSFAIMCDVFFVIYIFMNMMVSYRQLTQYNIIKNFFRKTLQLSDTEMNSLSWGELSDKIVSVPLLKFAYNSFDELSLVNMIMRKENYLIALINQKVFDVSFPFINENLFGTKSLERVISYALFSFYFDKNGTLKRELMFAERIDTINQFRSHLNKIAIVSIIFSPLIWIYLLFFSILRYTQELRLQPKSMGIRKWSNNVLWEYREYNELLHTFEERMGRSYVPADLLINNNENYMIITLSKFFSFIFGSISTILLVVSIFNDEEMMWGKSIIWWIGIFGALFACTQLKNTEKKEKIPSIRSISRHTHKDLDYEKLRLSFQFKFVILLKELWSIIAIPYILLYHLYPKTEKIVYFFLNNSCVTNDDLGIVCSYATFTENIEDEKMKQSVVNFKSVHSTWIEPFDSRESETEKGEERSRDNSIVKSVFDFE